MKKIIETINYESSSVAKSTYDFTSRDLTVEFVGGASYGYEDVELDDYLQFSTSDSIGKAFNSWIRQYKGQKLTENA
jgi:hypothetical protein